MAYEKFLFAAMLCGAVGVLLMPLAFILLPMTAVIREKGKKERVDQTHNRRSEAASTAYRRTEDRPSDQTPLGF